MRWEWKVHLANVVTSTNQTEDTGLWFTLKIQIILQQLPILKWTFGHHPVRECNPHITLLGEHPGKNFSKPERSKHTHTCLKLQMWRRTFPFPSFWQDQPASPFHWAALPWTCRGRWRPLAGLVYLAWNLYNFIHFYKNSFFLLSIMECAPKVHFCEAFESYLFGTPFAKPPSYKGYQALPTPFSSPSKRATTFHRRHLIKFKIFVNTQARAVKADFWKALPKLPNSHLYPPFLKGLSSFCEALFMPIGWF